MGKRSTTLRCDKYNDLDRTTEPLVGFFATSGSDGYCLPQRFLRIYVAIRDRDTVFRPVRERYQRYTLRSHKAQ
jgi:hypothetical protein